MSLGELSGEPTTARPTRRTSGCVARDL